MTDETYKIQSTESLEAEMRAVARGDIPAPPDAHVMSAVSDKALILAQQTAFREIAKELAQAQDREAAAMKALRGIVYAWEAGGHGGKLPEEIETWLWVHMKPAIDVGRNVLTPAILEKILQAEENATCPEKS